jgi:hypothetical protein
MKESKRARYEPTAQEKATAYRVTRDLLTMARERVGGRPLFLFSISRFGDTEALLCAETGITCIPGVCEHLEQQKAQGVTVRVVNDGHWNRLGNKFVGEYLVQYLQHNPVTQALLSGYTASSGDRSSRSGVSSD